MTTVFKTTLKPILIMCQLFGLINISYTLEFTGLSIRNSNTRYYAFLELTRTFILIISTYFVHIRGIFYVQKFRLIKFWVSIIASRISEIWIIKLINGIIEFDHSVTLLSPAILVHQRPQSKTRWNIILILSGIYYFGFHMLVWFLWRPKVLNITTIIIYFFNMPYITDFVILITVCFYLINLGIRFQILNDFWKSLPAGLAPMPGEWTHFEIAMSVEGIRLLHAELSELMKVFNRGYGPLLLCFFVCSFIDMMYIFYLMLYHEFSTKSSLIEHLIKYLALHIFNVQIVIFMVTIVVAASWIYEKKIKIISYLRLNEISNLPIDTKLQVRMFMNQISISNFDETTAYGFFDINLNLVVSIIMLIMTWVATLIQMKNHPIIFAMINNTKSFHKIWENSSVESNGSFNGIVSFKKMTQLINPLM